MIFWFLIPPVLFFWMVPSAAQFFDSTSVDSAAKPEALLREHDGVLSPTALAIEVRSFRLFHENREASVADHLCGANRAGDTSLPNPAAAFCVEEGGSYKIEQGNGGARGLCVLPDGREVDAWDYFRERQRARPTRREGRPHMLFDRTCWDEA